MRSFCRRPLTLLALLAGCGAQAGSEARRTPELQLSEPVLIGGTDDREEYQFTSVAGAAVLSDGRILITDGGSKELRLFDDRGTFLFKTGREGEGPGEFRGIAGPTVMADGRIAVWDFLLHRLTHFALDGEGSETVSLALDTKFPVLSRLVGVLADGSFVVREETFGFELQDTEAGRHIDSTSVHFVMSDGIINQTLRIPEPEVIVWRDGSAWGSEDLIFSSELFFAVRNGRLLVVDSDSLVIDAYAPDGSKTRTSNTARRRPATRTLIEKERAALASEKIRNGETRRTSPGRSREQLRERARRAADRVMDTPAKDSLPVLGDLRVGHDQSLWVRGYSVAGDTVAVWRELDDSLVPIHQLRLPIDESLMAIGHGKVVSKKEDSLGLETVKIYEILKGDLEP